MQFLRSLYESVNWWELEPRDNGAVRTDGTVVPDWYQPRVKAKGDDVYLIWFPYGPTVTRAIRCSDKSPGSMYSRPLVRPADRSICSHLVSLLCCHPLFAAVTPKQ